MKKYVKLWFTNWMSFWFWRVFFHLHIYLHYARTQNMTPQLFKRMWKTIFQERQILCETYFHHFFGKKTEKNIQKCMDCKMVSRDAWTWFSLLTKKKCTDWLTTFKMKIEFRLFHTSWSMNDEIFLVSFYYHKKSFCKVPWKGL